MALKALGAELRAHLLTGISYMIPLVIAGAVIMGTARIGASVVGITDIWDASYAEHASLWVRLFHSMDGFGGLGLGLMLPFIAGFTAYSVADKPGLAPGFISGMLALNMNTGFLGALTAGLMAGYLTRWVVKRIRLPEFARGINVIFLAPVLGTLLSCLMFAWVIGIPLANLNTAMTDWLRSLSGINKVALAAIIGGMVGSDLGGPINKAAVVTAMALLTEGIYEPNTAAQVAIIVPPIGVGIATLIAKSKYTEDLRDSGQSAILMGLVGISEGAIPFAIADPLRVVPINILGSAVASAMAVGMGAVNRAPISGFYGWLAVESWPVYVLSIVVGVGIIAVLNALILPKVAQA